MPSVHYSDGIQLSEVELAERITRTAVKFAWFLSKGYKPHYWQVLFHTFWNEQKDVLCRYRHLVAGRRGGKTMSAAWEVLFYVLHPEQFHWDAHKVEDDRPLYVWIVAKDHPTGKASLDAFRAALKQAGLEHGKEYKENRGNRWFEFENGAFVHFRSAEDPESLRGAGLDIMWYDEAAFIPNARAWEVSRPAISDKIGLFISTTTPDGKNWFYREFWSDKAVGAANQGRVEYRSIDNPYFSPEEWLEVKDLMHPMLFKQEFMASFDSMAGKELAGDWLKYYDSTELPRDPDNPAKLALTTYIGVDPAISLADTADRFVMTLIGVSHDNTQVYLLEQWAGRIPFAEQLDLIQEWILKYRPQYVGVEAVAFQAALEQQTARIEGFFGSIPIFAPGKKSLRILSMSPLFKIGKVRIRKDHQDFINEWVDYDSEKKNPEDDCLDSMEIALRTAGVLLPSMPDAAHWSDKPAGDINELARRDRLMAQSFKEDKGIDEHLGGEW